MIKENAQQFVKSHKKFLLISAISAISALALYPCVKYLTLLVNRFLPLKKSLYNKYHSKTPKNGSWALITGGSEGIGFEYAKEFAQQGFNIILISREVEKLQRSCLYLKQTYNVDTKSISIDFNHSNEATIFEKIELMIKNNQLDIAILVNNIGHPLSNDFKFQTTEEIQHIMRLNIYPNLLMSRIIVPFMLKRQQKSAIINIGSFSGICAIPRQTVYSGAKKFVQVLSQDLGTRYKDYIDVICVIPGLVKTEALKNWKGHPILPSSAEDLVNSSLKDLRLSKWFDYTSYGTWRHIVFQKLLNSPITRKCMINKIYGIKI